MAPPSIVCPIDFSDASRGALRYAAALAEHFYAELTVIAIDDPFLTDAASAAMGESWLQMQTQQALDTFVLAAFPARKPQLAAIRTRVAVGRPADQILRLTDESRADAIVMSTHGLSGVRKLMFGSVTERVLRETNVPVIITPPDDAGPDTLEDWKRDVTRVVVPVDLTPWSAEQVAIGSGLASAIGAELLLVHVIEPVRTRPGDERLAAFAESKLRAHAESRLGELLATMPPDVKKTAEISVGDAAAEIARIARARAANVVVMGLHSAPERGRRMGTVTYRLLCQLPTLVVAWPPQRPRAKGQASGTKGRASAVMH